MNSLIYHNPQVNTGLGFRLFGKNHTWGSIAKSICKAAAKAVGGYIDSVTLGVFDASNRMVEAVNQIFPTPKGIAADDLTPAEQAIIQPWIDNKFTPYVKMLTNDLAAGIKLTDNAAKILVLNTVENKINSIQDHYAVAETTGLSQTAIDFREFLISTLLEPLHNIVLDTLKTIPYSNTTVTFNPSMYSFAPLFTSTPITSVQSQNYKVAVYTGPLLTINNGSQATTQSPDATTPTATTTTVKNPGLVTGTKLPVSTTVTPIQNVMQSALPTAAAVAAPAATKSNTALYIGGGILGVAAIYLATRKKKAKTGLAGHKAKAPVKRRATTKKK